jgi:hypothetical protein
MVGLVKARAIVDTAKALQERGGGEEASVFEPVLREIDLNHQINWLWVVSARSMELEYTTDWRRKPGTIYEEDSEDGRLQRAAMVFAKSLDGEKHDGGFRDHRRALVAGKGEHVQVAVPIFDDDGATRSLLVAELGPSSTQKNRNLSPVLDSAWLVLVVALAGLALGRVLLSFELRMRTARRIVALVLALTFMGYFLLVVDRRVAEAEWAADFALYGSLGNAMWMSGRLLHDPDASRGVAAPAGVPAVTWSQNADGIGMDPVKWRGGRPAENTEAIHSRVRETSKQALVSTLWVVIVSVGLLYAGSRRMHSEWDSDEPQMHSAVSLSQ